MQVSLINKHYILNQLNEFEINKDYILNPLKDYESVPNLNLNLRYRSLYLDYIKYQEYIKHKTQFEFLR